ncbi:MAG: Ppx/GppA phosphatase family protein [Gammaproteobacteria bacterium]
MPKELPHYVAALDLGSNSFHMIVCRLVDGKLQILDRLREMVRLASGLDKRNYLDIPTQTRALECLERFSQRIQSLPPESIRVVGTNTLRTAKNAQEFITKAEMALNHPIEIISGIEEARLIYMGVAYSLGCNGKQRLVMDIGGGSTEYILGTGNVPRDKESLHMGCVTVSDLFFKGGKLSKSAFARASLHAEQRLEPFQRKFHHSRGDEAIGASGTLRAVEKVLKLKKWSNNGITREGLDQLVDYICHCPHIDDLKLPDFNPNRLPVFPGGIAILYATFKSLGIEQMTVSEGALREGLVQDLLGRLYDHDIRSETVAALTERYHTDKEHAARIKQTIGYILSQLDTEEELASNETLKQFLFWAADLHEIGFDVAHSHYHKHSAYIIEHGDLAGFSRQDQLVLATIVRSHRRKFLRSGFGTLPAPWNRHAPILTLILRLAVLLRRNRHEHDLPKFELSFDKTKIHIKFPDYWISQAPLTQADLAQEADIIKSAGFKLEFS